eukprot:CFRG3802T1
MTSDQDTVVLEGLLCQLLTPDNDVIQRATVEIKRILKSPAGLQTLVTVICTSNNEGARQMGATLLKQRIASSWMKLTPDFKQAIKDALLHLVLNDPVRSVRQGVARAICMIAKHEVPSGQWPNFMEWLSQCTNSTVVAHKEIGMLVLCNLCETMGEQLKPFYGSMFGLFQTALHDRESAEIPFYCMQTMSTLLPHFETQEYEMLRAMLPQLKETCMFLLANDENQGVKSMEFFDELMDSDFSLSGEDAALLMGFFIEVASNTNAEHSARQSAISQIVSLSNSDKKSIIIKNGLVPHILRHVFQIMSEPEEEDAEEDEGAISDLAAQIIDNFALNMPPSSVVDPSLEIIGAAMSNPNARYRRAAIIGLAVLAEGCSEYLKGMLSEILPALYKGLEDPEVPVREASCLALAQFSQYCQPDIGDHCGEVMPRLFASLESPSDDLREKSVHALESFCEHLGDKIVPYLDTMMTQMRAMLLHGSQGVQEVTVLAIAAAAVSAGPAFEPYLPEVYGILKQLMCLTTDETASLRAYATECLGHVMKNLGRKYFENDLPDLVRVATEGLTLEDPVIAQCTYGFFGALSVAFKKDFAPYLTAVIPILVGQIKEAETSVIYKRGGDEGEIDLNDTDDEDEDENEIQTVMVDPTIMDAASSAIDTLGYFAVEISHEFVPYIEACLPMLLSLLEFKFNNDIRKAVVSTLCDFIRCSHTVFDESKEWKAGIPVPNPLSQQTMHLISEVVPKLTKTIQKDYDRMVVLAIGTCLEPNIPIIGPAMIEGNLQDWCNTIAMLINRQVVCQIDDGEEDEDAEHTMAEYDSMLVDVGCDLLSATAQVMGPSFNGPYFETFAKILRKFYKQNSSETDRNLCMGTLSDLIKAMGVSVVPYAEDMYQMFAKAVADPDEGVKVSAIFTLGVLAENCPQLLRTRASEMLTNVYGFFTDANTSAPLMDNCCAMVARMVIAGKQLGGDVNAVLPLDKVIPVVVGALPLKEDMEENEVVCAMLLGLFETNSDVVFPHLPQLTGVFSHLVSVGKDQSMLSDTTMLSMTTLFKHLSEANPNELQQCLAPLSEIQRNALVALIHS